MLDLNYNELLDIFRQYGEQIKLFPIEAAQGKTLNILLDFYILN